MPKADILIVEDDRIVAEDTKITLKKLGFGVSGIVPSGEEVLKKVETEPPDLVLMDIELEGKMDGIEAAARIRDRFNIPVVYVTGYADEDVLERAKVTEPFGYIVKPFEDRELNSAIEIALYKHKMESKLKENEKNLAKAQQISHIGSWKWDIIENKISWTNELYSIFGLSPQKFDVNYDAYLKCIHPDDLESFKKLTQKALRTKKSYNAEYRIIRPNKEIRIVNEIGEIGVDLNDTPISLFGTVQDITERKQIEQKLKYSNLQLEAVFNHLDSIIYITDVDSCEVLYMNDYMKKAFGKDFTGKICWKSFHENQDGPCDFCTNDKLIDTNGNPKEPYIWQFYNQTLNRWYELHDQAIPWTNGRLVRMEIALDITERKLSEIAVNRREQYLKALNSASQLLLIPTDTPPFQKFVNLIGPVSQASRTYIFINHNSSDGRLLTSQKAEWCAKGITPEINNPALQNMSYDALIPHLKETLRRGDVYKGCLADFPDKEREILEPQGILDIISIFHNLLILLRCLFLSIQ